MGMQAATIRGKMRNLMRRITRITTMIIITFLGMVRPPSFFTGRLDLQMQVSALPWILSVVDSPGAHSDSRC